MADFAEINTGTAYLSLEVVQELVLAYSERRQCVGSAAVDPIEDGFNLQQVTFWRGMQDWIETNCVKWVDHENGPLNTESTGFLLFTLSAFRTVAGFETDGFRRATEWPGTFSYGKIVAGDIIGPWIVEDLQKALDALRWVYGSGFNFNNQDSNAWPRYSSIDWRAARDTDGATWEANKTLSEAGYDAEEQWTSSAFIIGAMSNGEPSRTSQLGAGFATGAFLKMSSSFPLAATISGYFLPEAYTFNSTWDTSGSIFDANGDGVVSGVLNYSSDNAYTASSSDAPLGDIGHDPMSTYPVWCDDPASEKKQRGWLARKWYALFKFDFTNTLPPPA